MCMWICFYILLYLIFFEFRFFFEMNVCIWYFVLLLLFDFFLFKDSVLFVREYIWVVVCCRDSLLIICIIYFMNEMSFLKVWYCMVNIY